MKPKLKVPKGSSPGRQGGSGGGQARPIQTSARMLLDKVLPERVDEKGNARLLWPTSP